jgi:hypothetical protein
MWCVVMIGRNARPAPDVHAEDRRSGRPAAELKMVKLQHQALARTTICWDAERELDLQPAQAPTLCVHDAAFSVDSDSVRWVRLPRKLGQSLR